MPLNTVKSENRRRGCLFCITGQEKQVASVVETLWPGMKAYPVTAAKRRSRNGVKSIETEVIMPSYVFFEMEDNFLAMPPFPTGVIRILNTGDGDWKLTGRDDEFAGWVMEHKGVLELSKAHKEVERIIVHQGPLKELEGYVLKIDKRNENGLVQLDVGGTQIRMWLPFEMIEE